MLLCYVQCTHHAFTKQCTISVTTVLIVLAYKLNRGAVYMYLLRYISAQHSAFSMNITSFTYTHNKLYIIDATSAAVNARCK